MTSDDRLLLLVLGGSAFASAVAARATDPMVNAIAADFATPVATVALLASAYTLPYGLCQPVLGPLGDSLGKAAVLKVCTVVFALALAACVIAPDLGTLAAGRIVAGIAAGGVIPLALAMIGDRFPMEQRQIAIGRFLTAALVGQFVGVTTAGILSDWIGWRGGLASTAVVAAIAAAGVVGWLKPGAEAPPRGRLSVGGAVATFAMVLRNPRAAVCYGSVFLESIAIYGVLPFVPELLAQRGGGTATQAGLAIAGLGIGGLMFSLFVAQFLRVFSPFGLMVWGGLIGGAGLAGLAFSGTWPFKMACFTVIGLGFFMLHNSLQNRATELAPQARGSAVSLHAFFFFIGQALAPALFGIGLHSIGATPMLLGSAVLLAGVGTGAALLLRRVDRREGHA